MVEPDRGDENFYNGGINDDVYCCVVGLEKKPLTEYPLSELESNMGPLWDYTYAEAGWDDM
jgi:hypothetical protein